MELFGIDQCILLKLNANDWPKNQKIEPMFVETVFDAYTIFNEMALTPSQKK